MTTFCPTSLVFFDSEKTGGNLTCGPPSTGTESNTQRKDLSKDLHKEDSLIVESKKCFEEAEDSPIEESKNLFEEGKQRILLELDALRRPIEAPSLLPQSDNPLAFGTMPSLVPL